MFETAVPICVRNNCAATPCDPRWALFAAILGSGMAFLDSTVVGVALPVMQRELAISTDLVQWIIEAYALLLASLVLVGGALGDRHGRARMFTWGVVVFAAASTVCGLAPNALTLVIARAAQGIGAALLVPGSLSIISAAYSEEKRGRAIGTWSAFSAMTSAIGPVIGGWVVMHASWRWLFFFNIPIAIAVVMLVKRGVVETRDESSNAGTDWLGASLATVGLGLLVFALIDSRTAGNVMTVTLMFAGGAALIAFVLVEKYRPSPMMPLALFRSPTFAGTNILTMLLYAALGGALFFVPFNLIQVQQYSPAEAGASLLPFVLLVSAMSRWSGALASRIGARPLLIAGPLVATAGFAMLAVPAIGGSYWSTFFPGILLLGIGMGITAAPLTVAVMGAVDAGHAGVASGINNAVARAAGLLAVAGLGVLLFSQFNRVLDSAIAPLTLPAAVHATVDQQRASLAGADLSGVGDPVMRAALRNAFGEAYVAGFRACMIGGAVLAALSACGALCVRRRPSSGS